MGGGLAANGPARHASDLYWWVGADGFNGGYESSALTRGIQPGLGEKLKNPRDGGSFLDFFRANSGEYGDFACRNLLVPRYLLGFVLGNRCRALGRWCGVESYANS